MIDIQTDAKTLLAEIERAGLAKDEERPADPAWLRERFPQDATGLELNLHIMDWQQFLQHLCEEITEASKQDAVYYDYINRDAEQIRLANDIKAHHTDEHNQGRFYFDTTAPLDQYSSYITYDELVQRAKEYRNPKEIEQ